MRMVMADGTMLLCDSIVSYNGQDEIQTKYEYTYDAQGHETSWTTFRSNIIWQGEQTAVAWDGQSLRFSDNEGKLPSLSEATYDFMVGCTMCLVITEVNGDNTWIRVTDGWWSEAYVPNTPVHAGETFRFEFTQLMADRCKDKNLMFLSNNGLTITKFYIEGPDVLPENKEERSFDINGYVSSWAHYSWHIGEWVGMGKYEYTHDTYGNRTSELHYIWLDGEWVGSSKLELTYDTYSNRTSEVFYRWLDGEWVVDYNRKFEHTYDANGNQTSEVNYYWQDGAWIVHNKYDCAYDAYGNLTSCVEYYWQGGAWIVSFKGEYTYDANGNLTSQAWYNWQNGTWVGDYKYESTYDANGNETRYVHYIWQDGAWVANLKIENTYDVYGNRTNYTHFYWQDGAWIVDSKTKCEYTYDANGKKISNVIYYWHDGAWLTHWKYLSTYDSYGNLTSETSYEWQNGAWILVSYKLKYYSIHNLESSLDQIPSDTPSSAPHKQLLPDGRIVIVRDGRIYNVGGQQMK